MSEESIRMTFHIRCEMDPENMGLSCLGGDCEHCGWNPEVHQERVERLRRGEPAVERRTEK